MSSRASRRATSRASRQRRPPRYARPATPARRSLRRKRVVYTLMRAAHAERHGPRVLARRVTGAREVLAVATAADGHLLSALVAIEVGLARRRRAVAVGAHVARGLALRVVRAAGEPAVLRPPLRER